jgi:hypothetical protein
MTRPLIEAGGGRPLLDIASYARRGPGRRDRLSIDEIELISRTVRRTPAVMVKVLSRGGQDLKAVGRHVAYLSRDGEVSIETDDGQRLSGNGVEKGLLENWDMDLEEHRRKSDLQSRPSRPPPKLVHKLMFSMPTGTQPDKVLAAVKNFAREELGLKHRYLMALHTDTPRPHVHVVIKAVSEQGQRLHIRKATLREWRLEFARHLRALGVAANATPRYVRGETGLRKPDGIYRASLRGESTYMRERAEVVARELARGTLRIESGKASLVDTRNAVRSAWLAVGATLIRQGQPNLAAHVRQFTDQMAPPMTEKEWVATRIAERGREPRAREGPPH